MINRFTTFTPCLQHAVRSAVKYSPLNCQRCSPPARRSQYGGTRPAFPPLPCVARCRPNDRPAPEQRQYPANFRAWLQTSVRHFYSLSQSTLANVSEWQVGTTSENAFEILPMLLYCYMKRQLCIKYGLPFPPTRICFCAPLSTAESKNSTLRNNGTHLAPASPVRPIS